MGTRSFILLKHLSSVDFPHPEGPISATTRLRGISIVIPFIASESP